MKQTVTPNCIYDLLRAEYPDDSDGIVVRINENNPFSIVIDFRESNLMVDYNQPRRNQQKRKPKSTTYKSANGERIVDLTGHKMVMKYQVNGQWFDEFEDANPENDFLGTVDARYLNTTLKHMWKTEKHIKDLAIGGISAIVALILTMTTLFLFIWGVL